MKYRQIEVFDPRGLIYNVLASHNTTCVCVICAAEETYFASQYYLGHRRFETGDPELFLFGELTDLNYLPDQPVAVSLQLCVAWDQLVQRTSIVPSIALVPDYA